MILVIVLVSLIALVLLFVVKQRQVFKLTERIPGPTPLPFIGNAFELGTKSGELLKNLLRLKKTYGGVVRVCMGSRVCVLLTDPKYMAQVLATTADYYKGDLYKIVQPMAGDGLISSSGEKWARHRRILTSAFTNKHLANYVVAFNHAANQLVDQLKQLVHLEYIEVTDPVFVSTLYSVCKTVMGVDITKNLEYHRNADRITVLFFNRFMSPWKMSDFFYRFTSEYRETQTLSHFINDFVEGVIAKRKQELIKESKDDAQYTSMLDEMLRLSGEDVLTREEIVDEVKTFVFAGSDTVGITISFAMYELAKHPDVQAKLLEEIEYILGVDLECDIKYEDLHQLKYMECVVKEILRIYTPAIMISRTLPSEMYFDDLYVPADTVAFMLLYGLHHSEEFYPDPEKFDPDRFLPENFVNQHKNSYIPFASGARACIGNKFAMLEAKLTLAKIIWNFELFEKPGHEPELIATGTLKSANGLPVKLKIRQSTRT